MDGGFRQELKRPSTAVAAGLALFSTVVGLIVSIYLYQKSLRSGELSYSIEQVQVYQADFSEGSGPQKSPISVLDKQGMMIRANIYAAKIKIWNSGADEIKNSDVRSAPKILFDGDVRLLDYGAGYATSNNVDEFAVSQNGELSWRHFDSQQGFVVTVLYSSDRQHKIKIESFVAGMAAPIDRIENHQHLENMFSIIFVSLILMVVIFYLIYAIARKIRNRDRNLFAFTDSWIFTVFMTIFMISNIIVTLGGFDFIQRWLGLDPRPPF